MRQPSALISGINCPPLACEFDLYPVACAAQLPLAAIAHADKWSFQSPLETLSGILAGTTGKGVLPDGHDNERRIPASGPAGDGVGKTQRCRNTQGLHSRLRAAR